MTTKNKTGNDVMIGPAIHYRCTSLQVSAKIIFEGGGGGGVNWG